MKPLPLPTVYLRGPRLPPGQSVLIKTDMSGDNSVEGQLLRCGPVGITLRRTGRKVGPVNIYCPPMGQIVVQS
jgi:hypothetical protein